ncbi:MAG: hypothetical protein ACTSVU_09885 [Promethearchaeota archaeon]
MMHIILTETALEIVPKKLQSTPAFQKNLKKFGNAGKLLDTTLHHAIMNPLSHSEKRGRPDILHHFLLDSLGSIANHADRLKIYFACSGGLFSVSSQMRCPRDYLRFKALMSQLLEISHIPKKSPYLIEKIAPNLSTWIKGRFTSENVVKLTSKGRVGSLRDLFAKLQETPDRKENMPSTKIDEIHDRDFAVLIGGFQKGGFSETTATIPGIPFAFPNRGYDSWVIVNRILSLYEQILGLWD